MALHLASESMVPLSGYNARAGLSARRVRAE
jgi:hypothetical protein